MDIGLLLLRLVVGLTIAAHGTQKLFGWFGGPGLDGTGRFLATIGFPTGRRSALIAGLGEVCGGVFLAFGLLTPAAAALLLSVMLVAAVTVHMKNGFFVQNGGYEYTLVLGIAALTVAFAGPGSLSLDALLGHRLSGAFWGIAALFVGACGAAISLIQRRAVLPKETATAQQASRGS
jgi:putative oxidoreductase